MCNHKSLNSKFLIAIAFVFVNGFQKLSSGISFFVATKSDFLIFKGNLHNMLCNAWIFEGQEDFLNLVIILYFRKEGLFTTFIIVKFEIYSTLKE